MSFNKENPNLIKKSPDFSQTNKYNVFIRNPEWQLGYPAVSTGTLQIEVINGVSTPIDQDNSALWRFLSASTEDLGNQIFERIDRFITNIRDIDTAELHALNSMAQELGYDGDTTFLSYNYPLEIYNLLNIFSVNKEILFSSDKILNQLQQYNLFPSVSGNQLSAAINVMSGYVKTIEDSDVSAIAYTDAEWSQVSSTSADGNLQVYDLSGVTVSGDGRLYNYVSDENYLNILSGAFSTCLSAFVFLKYRFEEVYQTETPYIVNNIVTSGATSGTLTLGSISGVFDDCVLSGYITYNDYITPHTNGSCNFMVSSNSDVIYSLFGTITNMLEVSSNVISGGITGSIYLNTDPISAASAITGYVTVDVPASGAYYSTYFQGNTLSNTSGYIWQHITDQLYGPELWIDKPTTDDTIIELKLRLDIPLTFPEKEYVDDIEVGKRKLSDFTPPEQLVLQAEIRRRQLLIAKTNPLQQFKTDRERKVREYFRFIENFNTVDTALSFVPYSIDDSKMLLSGDRSSTFMYTSACTYQVSAPYIDTVSYTLRNIALKISYFRESLKRLAQKHALMGTSEIVKITVNELFEKYVYDTFSKWRYLSGGSDNFNLLDIVKPSNFSTEIIDYWDSNEYFNISALPSYPTTKFVSGALVNERYWLDEYGTSVFTDAEISAFYNKLGVTFPVTPATSALTYTELLSGFLARIYGSAALSAYNNPLASTINYVSGDAVSIGVVSSTNLAGGYFDNWPFSGLILYEDNLKLHTSGLATFTLVSSSTVSTTPLYQQTSGDTIIIGSGPASQMLVCGYAPSGFYYLSGIPYTTQTTSGYILSAEVTDLYYYSLWPQAASYVSGVVSGGIYLNSDPFSAASAVCGTFQASLPTSGTSGFVDANSDVLQRYIGNVSGVQPYGNYKNQIHPSYALHPFLKRFVEIQETTLISLENLFNMVVSTIHDDFDELSVRIDSYGDTIRSWMPDNISYTLYQTAYEHNTNLDDTEQLNENIEIDGPWNVRALSAYLDDTLGFIESTSAGTNEFYQHIDLTAAELLTISYQLASVSGDAVSGLDTIRGLYNKVIYQYGVDSAENNYILFKDDRNFDLSGRIWVRYKNHPLALPFSALSGQTILSGECGYTSQLSNVDTTNHVCFKDCVNQAFDFGIQNNWMYVVWSDNINSNVAFGQLEDLAGKIYVYQDLHHNFRGFPLSGTTEVYVGTYSHEGIFTVLSVSATASYPIGTLVYDSDRNKYLLPLKFYNFSPENGITYGSKTIWTRYNISTPNIIRYVLGGGDYYYIPGVGYYLLPGSDYDNATGYRNLFRLTTNSTLLSLCFESNIPISAPGQLRNSFNDSPSAGYYDLLRSAPTLSGVSASNDFPSNGLTILEFEFDGDTIDFVKDPVMYYSMPFSKVRYTGIFRNSTVSANNFNGIFRNRNNFNIEFFADKMPYLYPDDRGVFKIDDTIYRCFIDFDDYFAYESVPNIVPNGDSIRCEDDSLRIDESFALSGDVLSGTGVASAIQYSPWLSGARFVIEDMATSGQRFSWDFEDESDINAITHLPQLEPVSYPEIYIDQGLIRSPETTSVDLSAKHVFSFQGKSSFNVSSNNPHLVV